MTSELITEAAAKKDIAKLQRAIVDGLEDVKAIDIQVFNTEHLSPLFERVIVASGASNRQTRALSSSVRDSVKDAGFQKPRVEGEDNGEWIIVDCGSAVVHIMQPAIRVYYHLEELWGDKPVRLKLGAPKPQVADSSYAESTPAKKKVVAKKASEKTADKAARKPAGTTTRKPPARRSGAPAGASSAASAAAKKTAAKKTSPTSKPKTVIANKPPAKPAAKKTPAPRRAPR